MLSLLYLAQTGLGLDLMINSSIFHRTSFFRTPDLIWLVVVLASSVFPHIHVMSDSEHQLHEQLYYFICCTIKLLTTDGVMKI